MPSESSVRPGIDRRPFRVAGWRVDPSACRLARDGEEIHIEPKVMQVLVHLAERPGQVVGRRELEELVWTDTVVGYEAVTNAVIKLRKALDDDARHPEIIETIPKRGYRLLGEVTPLSPKDSITDPRAPPLNPSDRLPRARSAYLRVGLLVVVAGVLGWFLFSQPDVEPASVEKMAFPLPKEPSIAVLPFDNLSGDEGQDFLADAFTEDIITALAQAPSLFVIARNSSFVYDDKSIPVKQVAEELGVRYVLEGSIQRDGDRIRITAQLIDALTGHHVWAERYDREFKDLLALQDEISEKLYVELEAEIAQGVDFREMHTRVSSPEAFEYLMKARSVYLKYSKESNAIGLQLIEKAAEIEPDNPEIWLYEGYAHYRDYRMWWSEDREASLDKAIELGERAYAAEPNYSATNGLMGVLSMARGDHDTAVAYARRSVELEPNSAINRATFAWILAYAGHPAEAIQQLQKAMRLSPHYPAWFTGTLGLAYLMMQDYDNAIAAHEQLIKRNSLLVFAYSRLAGIYATLGNDGKANEYAAELLKLNPKFTVQSWAKRLLYKHTEDLERELNMLRKAGLPEGGDS